MRLLTIICISLFLFIFQINLSGQRTKAFSIPPALDSFYTRINKAELFIADNNLPAAILCYRKASEFHPLDFTDRINLLQCYIKSSKIPEAVGVIIQMAEDQYGLVFLNDKKYIDLINDENWIYYVENNYKQPPPYPIRNQIIEMNNSFSHIWEVGSDSAEIIKQEWQVNIKNMLITNGYPSEQELGYGGSSYHPSLYNPIFHNVLFNAFSYIDHYTDSILTDQFIKGKLSRELYVTLNARVGKKDCGCEPFRDAIYLQHMDKIYSCTKQREEAVNKRRKELLLPTISDGKKLIEFQINVDQNFRFRNEYNAGTYISRSDELFDINDHRENLELIKTLDSTNFYFQKKD